MLDAVGLVDMNGRVYDPTIGRFLSADSVVQSLGLTQTLNPYAYAGGNPVRYIDPSGHDFFDTLLSVAIIAVSVWAGLEVWELAGDFLATCDAVGSLAADVLMGAAGGFVGGFVGVALSTGNLTAALHAGLISAAVGGAMGAVGTLWSGADPAASWKYPPNVIAHAVVGCGGAMLSGGNCGKGALAAAVSDVAGGFVGSDSNPFSGKSLGDWGDVIQGAEVGLVGGGTAALSGGSFRDGFTTGAAGYLFNQAAHGGLSTSADDGSGGALDVLGKIWNLPNTAIGLVYGSLGYAVGWGMYGLGLQDVAPGIGFGNNAIQFTNNPFASLGAITLGNVEVFGGSPSDIGADGNVMGVHEMQHTYQGQMLGPLYLPSNILGGLAGLVLGGDFHAPQNWNEVGPQQHPPTPWP